MMAKNTEMKIVLVRHGQSIANKKGIKQRQKIDIYLSEKGKLQAEKVSKRLGSDDINAIYSSDLKRAKQTSEIIAQRQNIDINF